MLGSLKQNISFALRTLLKNKGFTLTAVLVLKTSGDPKALFRALGMMRHIGPIGPIKERL